MKIVKKMPIPPSRPWMNRNWECSHCKSVVFLGEEDEGLSVKWESDQRDGGFWIIMKCPICSRTCNFYDTEPRRDCWYDQ